MPRKPRMYLPDVPAHVVQVGRTYVQYINRTYKRSGTLWEGRHKASLIDAQGYLLSCYRYIELNPVAAAMVASPDDYPWSSYRCHGLGEVDFLVADHPLFMAQGKSAEERQVVYRGLFKAQIPRQELDLIRSASVHNFPLGNDAFREQIEAALGRRIGQAKRGRPAPNINHSDPF
ncbi:MAG: putative transposase [Motiliproteus sp.]|jgi:putative transposase